MSEIVAPNPCQEPERMIEQLRVQLAGCSAAALGSIHPDQVAREGDYGWSPAYQDVLDLRRRFEKVLGEAHEKRIAQPERHSVSYICAVCGGFGDADVESLDSGTTFTHAVCGGKTVVLLLAREAVDEFPGLLKNRELQQEEKP